MTPYSHTMQDRGDLDAALADVGTVRAFLAALPDADTLDEGRFPSWPATASQRSGLRPSRPSQSPLWTCHALARAAAALAGLALAWEAVDGWFTFPGMHHAWLEHQAARGPDGRPCRLLLDVYPVAALTGPALYDAVPMIHRKVFVAVPAGDEDRAMFDAEARVAMAAAVPLALDAGYVRP